MTSWMVPEGLGDLLAEQTSKLENLRQQLLSEMQAWGYQQVMPPLAEFLDGLLTGTGSGLNLATFKVADHHSGRTLGIRPDFTPQIARIDASRLTHTVPNRLCYVGEVLQTRVGAGISRSPIQLGAELFGSSDDASDLEIMELALKLVSILSASTTHGDIQPVLVLSQPALFTNLLAALALETTEENQLHHIFLNDAQPELQVWLSRTDLSSEQKHWVQNLFDFKCVLVDFAAKKQCDLPSNCREHLDVLASVAQSLHHTHSELHINFDLADLRGFNYHSGMAFCIYDRSSNTKLVWGGRYDNIGQSFGKARPATGFSMDLRELLKIMDGVTTPQTVLVPAINQLDETLHTKIRELRSVGYAVIHQLPDVDQSTPKQSFDYQLVYSTADRAWCLKPFSTS